MVTPIPHQTKQRLSDQIPHLMGASLDSLLEPISESQPSGDFLKGNGVYSAIKEARSADDPSLPMGEWQHRLSVADWEAVSELSISALQNKTKDMQIAIWLLEAQIHRFGFQGLPSALMILSTLTETFWEDIHPQLIDGDIEYRTNLLVWLNEKLLPSIRTLPITACRQDRQFSWSDWEMAIQLEQHADVDKATKSAYANSAEIVQAISLTPIAFYQDLVQHLADGLACVAHLQTFVDEECAQDAPSISALSTLLQEIHDALVNQLQHRGLSLAGEENDAVPPDESSAVDAQQASSPPPSGSGTVLNSREAAYQQLAEAAEYLKRDDPHSPVPYLVFKAIEWGGLNTAELYQQLFVQYQGQINIFEVLGLDVNSQV